MDRPYAVKMPRNLFLVLIAGLAVSGCHADEGHPDTNASFSVRDSAGVQIVSVDGLDSAGAAWQLASSPEVVIGVLEGPAGKQLFDVRDATRLSDGRIAVANAGTFELRFYSSRGDHLDSVGGEGDGPGEFRSVLLVDAAGGDSMYVWDQRALRISVLDMSGRFLRSFQLTAPEEHSFPRYWASFPDGSVLGRVSDIVGTEPEDRSVGRSSTTLMRFGREGQPLDTVVVVENEPTFRLVHPGGQGFSFFPLPFAPGGTWTLDGMSIHAGTGESYEVRTYDQAGDLIRILRAPIVPARVTDALVDSYVAERLAASSGDEEWQDLLRSAFADMPHPDVARVFDALATDAGGRLWVRRTAMPRDSLHRWDVFDPDGRPVARALVPAALRVREFGSDYVLALRRDDLGVEQVVLFSLQKP